VFKQGETKVPTIPLNTLYLCVQARRDKRTYNVLIRKSIQDKMDMVIDVTGGKESRNILLVTMSSTTSSSLTTVSTTSRSTIKRTQRFPSKQVLINLNSSKQSWIMKVATKQLSRKQQILLP
jgi:hypothetical protein